MDRKNIGDMDNRTGCEMNMRVKPIEESRLLQNPEPGVQNAGGAATEPENMWKGAAWGRTKESPLVGKLRRNYGYFGGLCLLYGVLFAFCLYRNPNGITYPLLVFATIGISYQMLRKIGFAIKKDTVIYVVGMVLLGIGTAMTCSEFLIFFNTVGILLLFLTAMMHQFYADENWSFPIFIKNLTVISFTVVEHVFWPFVHGAAYLAGAREESGTGKKKSAAAVSLGLLIAIGLLLVIFPMLLRSDMIFAGLFENIIWDFRFETSIEIILMFLIGFVASYAFFSALCSKQFEENEERQKNYPALIAVTFTGILAAVYILYAGIQVLYLFLKLGGLPEGVTYSEYARKGFFELLFVGIVNFILVLVCKALFRKNKVLYGILTVICGCTFVMIASAAYRMMLYVQIYHFTFLRVLVLWFLTVLAFIMAGVTISIYKKSFPLFRYIAVAVGCGYILFSFAKPDRLVAEYNLRHMEAYSIQDLRYMLYNLSDDAAPVIAELDADRVRIHSYDRETGDYVSDEELKQQGREELRIYFADLADRYEHVTLREVNLSKLQAKNAAKRALMKN